MKTNYFKKATKIIGWITLIIFTMLLFLLLIVTPKVVIKEAFTNLNIFKNIQEGSIYSNITDHIENRQITESDKLLAGIVYDEYLLEKYQLPVNYSQGSSDMIIIFLFIIVFIWITLFKSKMNLKTYRYIRVFLIAWGLLTVFTTTYRQHSKDLLISRYKTLDGK